MHSYENGNGVTSFNIKPLTKGYKTKNYQYERKGVRQIRKKATTNSVNHVHRQQGSRDGILEKAKTRTFGFKNIHQTFHAGPSS